MFRRVEDITNYTASVFLLLQKWNSEEDQFSPAAHHFVLHLTPVFRKARCQSKPCMIRKSGEVHHEPETMGEIRVWTVWGWIKGGEVLKRISHMTEDLCNKAHVALQDKTHLMRLNIGKKQEWDQIARALWFIPNVPDQGFSSTDGGERMGLGREREFHLMGRVSGHHILAFPPQAEAELTDLWWPPLKSPSENYRI